MARGRTVNISQHGLFIIVPTAAIPPDGKALTVEVTIPAPEDAKRTAVYSCRVVRRQAVGHLLGLGLEFQRKVS